MSINAIHLDQISVKINKKKIITKLSLNVEKGRCTAILGPSGAGKTTILRVIAGFIVPDEGEVQLFGHNVTNQLPEERKVSMLFQEPVLFPHLTVKQNATVGLSKRKPPITQEFDIKKIVEDFEIEEILDRKISDGLSGGQKQRAALLCTFVNAREILLLDEPLKSALNIELRWKLMRSIKMLARAQDRTTLIVTHDFEEAAYLADDIAVISENGKGLWQGSTFDMYYKPPNHEVARVLGKGTEIEAEIMFNRDKREKICPFAFENGVPTPLQGAHSVFIRPDKISIIPDGSGFIIKAISFLGEYSLIEISPTNYNNNYGTQIVTSLDSRLFSDQSLNKEVGAKLSSDALIIFDLTGKRIDK